MKEIKEEEDSKLCPNDIRMKMELVARVLPDGKVRTNFGKWPLGRIFSRMKTGEFEIFCP
jgi:hypothetical protein